MILQERADLELRCPSPIPPGAVGLQRGTSQMGSPLGYAASLKWGLSLCSSIHSLDRSPLCQQEKEASQCLVPIHPSIKPRRKGKGSFNFLKGSWLPSKWPHSCPSWRGWLVPNLVTKAYSQLFPSYTFRSWKPVWYKLPKTTYSAAAWQLPVCRAQGWSWGTSPDITHTAPAPPAVREPGSISTISDGAWLGQAPHHQADLFTSAFGFITRFAFSRGHWSLGHVPALMRIFPSVNNFCSLQGNGENTQPQATEHWGQPALPIANSNGSDYPPWDQETQSLV